MGFYDGGMKVHSRVTFQVRTLKEEPTNIWGVAYDPLHNMIFYSTWVSIGIGWISPNGNGDTVLFTCEECE